MRISAKWIWDGEGLPFRGSLDVADGRIQAVSQGESTDGDYHFDDAILVPGFVNAHCHLDLSFDPEDPGLEIPFSDWLLSVKDLRDEVGEEGLEEAARRGVQQSLQAGTTTLVDYDPAGASLSALADSPLRRLILREVISFSPNPTEILPNLTEFLGGVGDASRELRGIAPHAPYTVHPKLLPELIAHARALGVPWSTHIAEQPWESDFLERGEGEFAEFLARVGIDLERFGVPGARAVELLARSGGLSPDGTATDSLLVHANYVTPEEIATIATSGASIVFCPRSHTWFGHSAHPLPDLIAAGVPVAIGTDSLYSNGKLSILEELRELYHFTLDLPAELVLTLGTTKGHQALGNHFGTGRLTPDQPADFVAIPVNSSTAENTLPTLLESTDTPQATFIAGQCVCSSTP